MTKLVLLDRDGVINVEMKDYVKSPKELVILPQALKALALFKEEGWTPVIVTNQSVVGHGIITQSKLDEIHRVLKETVEKSKGWIAEIIVCTDRPYNTSNTPYKLTDRRKPGAGMLLEALSKYKTAPEETPFVGDALTDMEAAFKANCPRYLVMTGKGSESMQKLLPAMEPITICADIFDAAKKIVREW